jgi:hypothetical protein
MAKTARAGGKPKAATRTKAKAQARPDATARAKAKGGTTRKTAGDVTPAVRVRMYRQGLGDCFLLAFPKPEGGEFLVLIDCGVILGTPSAEALMKDVAADIADRAKGKDGAKPRIDVLVGTHEHWDHISGFVQAKDEFEKFEVGEVWLAWTEDPHDATANRLRKARTDRLAALWLGVGGLRPKLEAAGDEAAESVVRAAEVLSFFGIDPDEQPPPGGALEAAEAATRGKTAEAMDWLRTKTENPKFWKPGDTDVLPGTGVRFYVLGPPADTRLLFKDLPTRTGKETYEALAHIAAAARALAVNSPASDDLPGTDTTIPFDPKYQITEDVARDVEFFRDHYFGPGGGDDDPEDWRRIDNAWAVGAAEFALKLDSDTNNTSLALAFELPDGRVLLFPGDAQVGNWESWHADADGDKRVWQIGNHAVTAEMLLNRTVLYKVGHHGSHNATLRENGLEMMTDPALTAMVPVDVYIAHEKKRWTKMPFRPLMARLDDLARGRVLQADQPAEALASKARGTSPKKDALTPFLAQVTDADKQLEVVAEGEKTVKRPLYVEYSLPLK